MPCGRTSEGGFVSTYRIAGRWFVDRLAWCQRLGLSPSSSTVPNCGTVVRLSAPSPKRAGFPKCAAVERKTRGAAAPRGAGEQAKNFFTGGCPLRVGSTSTFRTRPVVHGRIARTAHRVPGHGGTAAMRAAARRMPGNGRGSQSGCRPRVTQFSLKRSSGLKTWLSAPGRLQPKVINSGFRRRFSR